MSPTKRIRAILRKASTIEDAAVREQLRLLLSMRRALMAIMGDAAGYRLFHLSQVLSAIDNEILRGRTVSQQVIAKATREVYQLGVEILGQQGFVGVSSQLLQAVIDVTTDQTRAVWSELGTRLKGAVRRATLGITDPADAVKEVAKLIRDKKTFASAMARADTIIRTEMNRSFSLGAWKEMQRSGEAMGTSLRKAWLTAGDSRVRDAHVEAGNRYDQKGAIPIDEPFVVDGEELMFPLDPSGSAGNTINCRCFSPGTRIDPRQVIAISKALYAGPIWRVETRRGHRLSLTSNHPVLTARGWVRAERLQEGDYLLSDSSSIDRVSLGIGAPDHQDRKPAIEDLFEAFRANAGLRSAVVGALDLHSEASRFKEGKIDLVFANPELVAAFDAQALERSQYSVLATGTSGAARPSLGLAPAQFHLLGRGPQGNATFAKYSPDGLPAGAEFLRDCEHAGTSAVEPLDFIVRQRQPRLEAAERPELRAGTKRLPVALQGPRDGQLAMAIAAREINGALSCPVAPDQITSLGVEKPLYLGPVYDVQTTTGLVHSGGIITHNCRLWPIVADTAA